MRVTRPIEPAGAPMTSRSSRASSASLARVLRLLPLSLALAALVPPACAGAQSRAQVEAAQRAWENEPSVNEAVQTALDYFRLSPSSFDHFRSAANLRALLPTLAAGVRTDSLNFLGSNNSTGDMTNNYQATQNQARSDYAITVGGIWDLRDLVFNPAEVQIYGLIGVQRDIMLEVTRDYFLRRQLMLRLATRPPEDPIAYAALELAISQYTAILDVLTGGWFSEQLGRRH